MKNEYIIMADEIKKLLDTPKWDKYSLGFAAGKITGISFALMCAGEITISQHDKIWELVNRLD